MKIVKRIISKNDDKSGINPEKKKRICTVNVKLLKRYLLPCAETVVYQGSGFGFYIISNIIPQIMDLSDDVIRKYGDKTLEPGW